LPVDAIISDFGGGFGVTLRPSGCAGNSDFHALGRISQFCDLIGYLGKLKVVVPAAIIKI
jgi:hypothetical protein